jgi:transposase InsO family protein
MNEEQKKEIGIFRFGVIHELVNGIRPNRGEQAAIIAHLCEKEWHIPHSDKRHLKRSTILRWLRRYRESNRKLEALYPADRQDVGKSRSLDEETGLALMRLRESMPKVTVPALIAAMEKQHLVAPGAKLSLTTVYRFLHAHNLMRQNSGPAPDRRKFEAELPNDLWQSDVMHGPQLTIDGRLKKTYLLAFIDDHSRLVPQAEFYLSEGLDSYLNALEQALQKRGLPRKLYVDNGAAFRSKHLMYVTASLGIALIHAGPYQPEGKGKIERFFRTVRTQFLHAFKGKSLYELNEAFDLWLHDVYHQRVHSATGESPFKRFTSHMECLRQAPGDLQNHFRKQVRRMVAKDRSVILNNKLFEAPVDLIGKQILLLYHDNRPDHVEIFHEQRSHGFLTPVNLYINARVKRDKSRGTALEPLPDSSQKYNGGKLFGKEHKNG